LAALLFLACTVAVAPAGAQELARFSGTWIKKNAPGIGTWIRIEVDAQRPSRVFLSWAAPFVAADAQGQYGANVVWRNDSSSCWYDMRRAGTELTVRLTKGDPPGACLEDSLFALQDAPPRPPLLQQRYSWITAREWCVPMGQQRQQRFRFRPGSQPEQFVLRYYQPYTLKWSDFRIVAVDDGRLVWVGADGDVYFKINNAAKSLTMWVSGRPSSLLVPCR
jgi:hypothetical protein